MVFILAAATVLLVHMTSEAHSEGPGASAAVQVLKEPDTSDVFLSNDRIRVHFLYGKPQMGRFPIGYTSYNVEIRDGDAWVSMAQVPYFTAYSYRSGWGRDWLHYVVPKETAIHQDGDAATVVFSETQRDLDRKVWHFTFSFTLRPGAQAVETEYAAQVEERAELLLFWGPKLHAGAGSFGAEKGEALFPGLEYLGPGERSSAMWALAPDARLHFVPHPAKITIPLMAVIQGGHMIGLRWDPMQHWHGDSTCPSAVFASPNWIEGEQNHLMGIFLPSVPDYVPENGLRAHTPFVLEAGDRVILRAELFAGSAAHATDAVDLWLADQRGFPEPRPAPRSFDADLDASVRVLADKLWNDEAGGWPSDYGGKAAPNPAAAASLVKAIPFLEDDALIQRVRNQAEQVAKKTADLPLALRMGPLDKALAVLRTRIEELLERQHPDGSWGHVRTEAEEGGLAGLMGPPSPGYIASEDQRTQGITARTLAQVMEYALITDDEKAIEAGLKGIADLDRYSIPFVYSTAECPPSPSVHGAYFGLRSCLIAYRITGDKQYLDRAVYWAKTGLPFIYLWTFAARPVAYGQVHTAEKTFVAGEVLYGNTLRDPMLYGTLYGYGSSQFMHHWYGLLVHWIGLVYARDLHVLARHDDTLPWDIVSKGILVSGMWQNFDKDPFTGHLPDAFSVERWVPSGPAFTPFQHLTALTGCIYDKLDTETVIVRDGARRCHVTSSVAVTGVDLDGGILRFGITDPGCTACRAVVSGLEEDLAVSVDGQPIERKDNLELAEECWSRDPAGLVLVKVRQTGKPRQIAIRPAQ
jgi:hypothetical protein